MNKYKDLPINNELMERHIKFLDCNIDNFNINEINKHIISSYKFRTENSKDINIKLLKVAEKIKRYETVLRLSHIIFDIEISNEIEKGIFEFSLLHVTTHGLEYKTVTSIYHDKEYDIIYNLKDPTNTNLLKSIKEGHIIPYAIAFLSPQQLNPDRWKDLLEKKMFRQEAENNMATTDRYRCRKCGERKAKVTELQIRSADEPCSLFITCLICYNTFII